MKWLNYTPETTCNNRYIVQRALIISEYSKHPHSEACQKLELTVTVDLLITLWLL
jgi:hypothetical protein